MESMCPGECPQHATALPCKLHTRARRAHACTFVSVRAMTRAGRRRLQVLHDQRAVGPHLQAGLPPDGRPQGPPPARPRAREPPTPRSTCGIEPPHRRAGTLCARTSTAARSRSPACPRRAGVPLRQRQAHGLHHPVPGESRGVDGVRQSDFAGRSVRAFCPFRGVLPYSSASSSPPSPDFLPILSSARLFACAPPEPVS